LQGHHLAGGIGQQQQVASRQLPQVARSVLDGGRIVRGHQRPHIGQVGQQRCRALERDLPLLLKIVKCGDGILQVALDSQAHLLLHGVPHHQRVVKVKAADTATMESRNLVRSRIPPMVKPLDRGYKRSEVRGQIAEVKNLKKGFTSAI
jgi:hypothetical protein